MSQASNVAGPSVAKTPSSIASLNDVVVVGGLHTADLFVPPPRAVHPKDPRPSIIFFSMNHSCVGTSLQVVALGRVDLSRRRRRRLRFSSTPSACLL